MGVNDTVDSDNSMPAAVEGRQTRSGNSSRLSRSNSRSRDHNGSQPGPCGSQPDLSGSQPGPGGSQPEDSGSQRSTGRSRLLRSSSSLQVADDVNSALLQDTDEKPDMEKIESSGKLNIDPIFDAVLGKVEVKPEIKNEDVKQEIKIEESKPKVELESPQKRRDSLGKWMSVDATEPDVGNSTKKPSKKSKKIKNRIIYDDDSNTAQSTCSTAKEAQSLEDTEFPTSFSGVLPKKKRGRPKSLPKSGNKSETSASAKSSIYDLNENVQAPALTGRKSRRRKAPPTSTVSKPPLLDQDDASNAATALDTPATTSASSVVTPASDDIWTRFNQACEKSDKLLEELDAKIARMKGQESSATGDAGDDANSYVLSLTSNDRYDIEFYPRECYSKYLYILYTH